MKYSDIIFNDTAAAPGVSVTFFTQGCPHRCLGCHNPETWDFNGGKEFTPDILDNIIDALHANDIHRNFCLMGGEPLCEQNIFLSYLILSTIKQKSPNTKIYVWTGYTYEQLKNRDTRTDSTLNLIDVLIDGPFILNQRDITLSMRGSTNQRIIELKN